MKVGFVLFVLVLMSSTLVRATRATSACAGVEKEFSFNMPIVLGNTIFNDHVEICKVKGKRVGLLTVPKRFSAELENVNLRGKKLSFSITADEGRGKFNVYYKGKLKKDNKFFVGVAYLDKKKKKVLGPFVGVQSEKRLKFKIVQ